MYEIKNALYFIPIADILRAFSYLLLSQTIKDRSMFKKIAFSLFISCTAHLYAQDSISRNTNRQRLDFAKMYFEFGGTYVSSFKGKQIQDNTITTFNHTATVNQYLTWGGFHFWGHAEFFVVVPLGQLNLKKNTVETYELDQSVVTGLRIYPWAMQDKKARPFVGVNWGAVDFKQIINSDENSTVLTKDFLLNFEAGLLYNYKSFGLRLGVNYNADNKWDYPLDKEKKAEIKTPEITASLGLLYAFDSTKDTNKENIDRWNSYPEFSKLSYKARRKGAFFIGIGPSFSFSLSKSDYNQMKLPYLNDKIASKNYFDIALGYHFIKANLFTALSFRNPKFETEGYGSSQTIKKTALALEVNKFLMDYSGFAPFVGLNISYDKLRYEQEIEGVKSAIKFKGKFEPGLTFGWDIVPGKTDEVLILRTNLRWYPLSEFDVNGQKFSFRQLEYNLIQLVFYPERMKKSKM